MGLTKNQGAQNVEVSEHKERIVITTKGGEKFEIVVNEEQINVYASTHFGSGLSIVPHSNNCIILSQTKI